MPKLLPGDIVLKYRPEYKGPFKYLVQRLILFFTTEWWISENTSKVCHAEMVYGQIDDDSYTVIDEEPPKVQFKTRGFNKRIIFRLLDKPPNFDELFKAYVLTNLRKRYEYWKLLLFMLDWIFHTNRFSKHWDLSHYYVCSEFVAKFFEEIGRPCSAVSFESSDPDEIFDYCLLYNGVFGVISDNP
jgi:hypothetical protein